MKKNNVLIIGAVAVAFGAIGAGVAILRGAPAPVTSTPAATAGAGQGQAPGPVGALYAQSLNDAAGAPHALSQWKGRALVVNFWAPWCAPCVQEMPELAELATELATEPGTGSAAKRINVIGIGIDTPSNIAQFASTMKITYPLYVAGMSGTELARNFGNSNGGLPYTVLIGADGKIKKTYLGRLKFAELKADLAKL